MTRRTQVEAALKGDGISRSSCFPLVDICYASTHSGLAMARLQLEPKLHAQALSKCARELPIDGFYINLCLSANQAAQAAFHDGSYHVCLDDAVELRFATNDVAAVKATLIRSLDDERIELAELFHPGMLETLQAVPSDVREEVAVCAGLTGAFSQLGFLLGLERLMFAMIETPAAVHRALRKRQQAALRQAAELCHAGARFIWIGEGMASSSLISPRMYTEFVFPYEQELAGEIRRLGALSLLHICGNLTPALAAVAESRVDGVDVDWPTDWSAAVEILGPRMCVKGNLNPLLFLPENQAGLAHACAETQRVAAPLRRFILSTGCLVPRDASPEAFEIMARACVPVSCPQSTSDPPQHPGACPNQSKARQPGPGPSRKMAGTGRNRPLTPGSVLW